MSVQKNWRKYAGGCGKIILMTAQNKRQSDLCGRRRRGDTGDAASESVPYAAFRQ